MSGLRETIRRRGGLELTSRVVGGLWVVGQRTVPSPYNAAATAALMAAFPTQWPTIRDYGFAHPEIVGYMNAYAPEDAKIAYSLVEGIGSRYLCATGSQYIDTGWIPSGRDFELQIRFIPQAIGSWAAVYGTYWTDGGLDNLYQNGTLYLYTANNYTSSMPVYTVGTEYKMWHNYSKIKRVNGTTTTEVNTSASSDFTTSRTLWLFGSANFNKFTGWIAEYIRTKDGVEQQKMYPFIRKINGVDTCGMIDVLSGTFSQNAGSGSFTISETPAS